MSSHLEKRRNIEGLSDIREELLSGRTKGISSRVLVGKFGAHPTSADNYERLLREGGVLGDLISEDDGYAVNMDALDTLMDRIRTEISTPEASESEGGSERDVEKTVEDARQKVEEEIGAGERRAEAAGLDAENREKVAAEGERLRKETEARERYVLGETAFAEAVGGIRSEGLAKEVLFSAEGQIEEVQDFYGLGRDKVLQVMAELRDALKGSEATLRDIVIVLDFSANPPEERNGQLRIGLLSLSGKHRYENPAAEVKNATKRLANQQAYERRGQELALSFAAVEIDREVKSELLSRENKSLTNKLFDNLDYVLMDMPNADRKECKLVITDDSTLEVSDNILVIGLGCIAKDEIQQTRRIIKEKREALELAKKPVPPRPPTPPKLPTPPPPRPAPPRPGGGSSRSEDLDAAREIAIQEKYEERLQRLRDLGFNIDVKRSTRNLLIRPYREDLSATELFRKLAGFTQADSIKSLFDNLERVLDAIDPSQRSQWMISLDNVIPGIEIRTTENEVFINVWSLTDDQIEAVAEKFKRDWDTVPRVSSGGGTPPPGPGGSTPKKPTPGTPPGFVPRVRVAKKEDAERLAIRERYESCIQRVRDMGFDISASRATQGFLVNPYEEDALARQLFEKITGSTQSDKIERLFDNLERVLVNIRGSQRSQRKISLGGVTVITIRDSEILAGIWTLTDDRIDETVREFREDLEALEPGPERESEEEKEEETESRFSPEENVLRGFRRALSRYGEEEIRNQFANASFDSVIRQLSTPESFPSREMYIYWSEKLSQDLFESARNAYLQAYRLEAISNQRRKSEIYAQWSPMFSISHDLYEQARNLAARVERNRQVTELKKESPSEADIVRIDRNIFNEFVANEQHNLFVARAAELPPREKNILQHAWAAYTGLSRQRKLAISLTLGAAITLGVGLTAGGVAAAVYGGKRLTRMVAGAIGSSGANRIMRGIWGISDKINSDATFEHKVEHLDVKDAVANLNELSRQYNRLAEEDRKKQKKRRYISTAVSLAAGLSLSVAVGQGMAAEHHAPGAGNLDHPSRGGGRAGGGPEQTLEPVKPSPIPDHGDHDQNLEGGGDHPGDNLPHERPRVTPHPESEESQEPQESRLSSPDQVETTEVLNAPRPIYAPEHAAVTEQIARPGDSLWKIAQRHFEANDKDFADLSTEQKTNAIANLMEDINKHPESFGIQAGHDLQPGDMVDFSSVDPSHVHELIEHAKGLTDSQIANIHDNNEAIQQWVNDHPGQSLSDAQGHVHEILGHHGDHGAASVAPEHAAEHQFKTPELHERVLPEPKPFEEAPSVGPVLHEVPAGSIVSPDGGIHINDRINNLALETGDRQYALIEDLLRKPNGLMLALDPRLSAHTPMSDSNWSELLRHAHDKVGDTHSLSSLREEVSRSGKLSPELAYDKLSSYVREYPIAKHYGMKYDHYADVRDVKAKDFVKHFADPSDGKMVKVKIGHKTVSLQPTGTDAKLVDAMKKIIPSAPIKGNETLAEFIARRSDIDSGVLK